MINCKFHELRARIVYMTDIFFICLMEFTCDHDMDGNRKKNNYRFFHRVLAIWKSEFSLPVVSETAGDGTWN